MNRNNGVRPTIYHGALKTPYPSPQRPKFASCDRLPPAQTPRPTWADFFEDLFKLFMFIGFAFLVVDLVLQIILYGYFQAPIPRPSAPGRVTHYDTLGIYPNADQHTIDDAWIQRSWTHQIRDKFGNTEENREDYYWIKLAYLELSDPLARCYHDQYHGFIPRKFGKDDQCTKILMERKKQATPQDGSSSREDDREGFFFANATWDKVYEKWGEWRDAMAGEKQWRDVYGDLVGGIQMFAKRVSAWPFIAIGLLFGLLMLLIDCIEGLAERYEWR